MIYLSKSLQLFIRVGIQFLWNIFHPIQWGTVLRAHFLHTINVLQCIFYGTMSKRIYLLQQIFNQNTNTHTHTFIYTCCCCKCIMIYNTEWHDDWWQWIGKEEEENSSGLIWGSILEFDWKDWGKPYWTPIRLVSDLAEIQTRLVPSTIQSITAWTNLFNITTQ